jgi:hypothetical protein
MWIEIDVLLKEQSINWQELGLDVKHEYAKRMVRIDAINFLQELTHDIQILSFIDGSSVYIFGEYENLKNDILHLSNEND